MGDSMQVFGFFRPKKKNDPNISLNDDVIRHIASFLDIRDFARFMRTNTRLHDLLGNRTQLCRYQFSDPQSVDDVLRRTLFEDGGFGRKVGTLSCLSGIFFPEWHSLFSLEAGICLLESGIFQKFISGMICFPVYSVMGLPILLNILEGEDLSTGQCVTLALLMILLYRQLRYWSDLNILYKELIPEGPGYLWRNPFLGEMELRLFHEDIRRDREEFESEQTVDPAVMDRVCIPLVPAHVGIFRMASTQAVIEGNKTARRKRRH